MIEPGINGLLFDFDDQDEFCGAIRQLYEDQDLRKRMGEAGQEKIERYRLEKVLLENIKKLYEGI